MHGILLIVNFQTPPTVRESYARSKRYNLLTIDDAIDQIMLKLLKLVGVPIVRNLIWPNTRKIKYRLDCATFFSLYIFKCHWLFTNRTPGIKDTVLWRLTVGKMVISPWAVYLWRRNFINMKYKSCEDARFNWFIILINISKDIEYRLSRVKIVILRKWCADRSLTFQIWHAWRDKNFDSSFSQFRLVFCKIRKFEVLRTYLQFAVISGLFAKSYHRK